MKPIGKAALAIGPALRLGAGTRCEDTFPFETGRTSTSWSITLQPVADGNAKTNDVDPNSFPQP
ncbi:hypothetical protein [Streptomyces sp. CBMA123]|uniref:hypothetical protein n=1 Tax=Streptomyces sp. CBMA123 TaxID=1896313 RepID=UPI001661BA8E|nr:hypothetical protein [Streptomyces sp. CBMA123]MBD0696053.1 hypothetical protein [Streptomyces sp. CBMA123]